MELKEVLEKWDNNEPIQSVEMGGIGPGYEQAIQVGIFELARNLDKSKLDDKKTAVEHLEKELRALYGKIKILEGLSGAQAAVIKTVAYQFVKYGYQHMMDKAPKSRVILVSKTVGE